MHLPKAPITESFWYPIAVAAQAGAIGYLTGVAWGVLLDVPEPGYVGTAFALFLACMVWTISAVLWQVTLTETISNLNNWTSEPKIERYYNQETRIITPAAPHHAVLDLPSGISRHQMAKFASGVLNNGFSLSKSSWLHVFKEKQYNDLMAAFMAGGMVEWKNPRDTKGGRQLTPAGIELLSSYLDPLPQDRALTGHVMSTTINNREDQT